MTKALNLNADMGESFGPWTMGNDADLLEVVASANVACGWHAGDPEIMRRTARMARDRGVSLGAHPSFPDLQGFGRRQMVLRSAEVEVFVAYQVGALMAIAALEGAQVTHVKPHGALNNMAAADFELSSAITRGVRAVDPDLILLAPAASELSRAGRSGGLRVADEIFADRAYSDDGTLAPRSQPGAMIHGAAASLAHVMRMLEEQALVSLSGKRLPVSIDSICVHGDGPDAVATASALRQGLETAGYSVQTLPQVLSQR